MRSKVRKWGNSLAIRIPKAFADEVGFTEDGEVDLSVVDDQLVISRGAGATLSLKDLLARVTEDNRHGEVDAGPSVGREAW
mgnify:CR=1 FL=1